MAYPSPQTRLRMLAALQQAGDMGLTVAELTQRTWGVKPNSGHNRIAGAMICQIVDEGMAARHGRRARALHWITPAGVRFLVETRQKANEAAELRAARGAAEPEDPRGAGPFFGDDEPSRDVDERRVAGPAAATRRAGSSSDPSRV